MNPKIDVYLNKAKKWQEELANLFADMQVCLMYRLVFFEIKLGNYSLNTPNQQR
jgi:hypothetical protein